MSDIKVNKSLTICSNLGQAARTKLDRLATSCESFTCVPMRNELSSLRQSAIVSQ